MFAKNIRKNQSFRKASKRFTKIQKSAQPLWKKYQIPAVAAVTLLLIGLLVSAQFTKAQPEEEVIEEKTRQVETLQLINATTSQSVPAQIKNLNSVTLVAQTSGPISSVTFREGANVYQGNVLVSQSTTYSGGNAPAVSAQIAQKNFELSEESLKNTVDIVSKNREIADKNRDNTEELRKITEDSIDETEDVLSLINKQIDNLESQIATAPDATTKLALEAQLIPLQSNANQTEQALRSLRYQVDEDNPPTELADAGKDLVYKSTEIQLKSAEIGRDIAALSYKQAQIGLSMTRVTAPFAGTVEKIYVEPGQYITAGTPVAKITGTPRLCVVATISGNLAAQINTDDSVTFEINGETYTQPINYVTSTPVNGNLFEVLITLPEWYSNILYENQSIEMNLPLLGSAQTDTQFIPVDAVFVTNTSRFVYVLEDGKVTRRIVETGSITGSSIEILSGLATEDTIILDRSVQEDEVVEGVSVTK